MKTTTFFTALLIAAATASPTLTTTTKDTAAVATDVPICKFDPVEGEYICPAAVADTIIKATIANGKANDTTFKDTATTAADCSKCDNDLNTCMKC
ncbi:hypothetical protein SLS59_008759 [Nothophoma quercina]|uniref:Uncharacterized protein n=1 Tax=Nothophoma quercina TaxID=749835 RepID=A0ABR3QRC2_9PLEO